MDGKSDGTADAHEVSRRDTAGAEIETGQQSDLLTFQEAGAWLRLDELGYKTPGEVIRHLCRARKLRHVKVGKRVFIRRRWLEEYLERESIPPLAEAR